MSAWRHSWQGSAAPRSRTTYSDLERTAALRHLLCERHPESSAEAEGLTAMQLRDRLIAADPVETAWIARINAVRSPWGGCQLGKLFVKFHASQVHCLSVACIRC